MCYEHAARLARSGAHSLPSPPTLLFCRYPLSHLTPSPRPLFSHFRPVPYVLCFGLWCYLSPILFFPCPLFYSLSHFGNNMWSFSPLHLVWLFIFFLLSDLCGHNLNRPHTLILIPSFSCVFLVLCIFLQTNCLFVSLYLLIMQVFVLISRQNVPSSIVKKGT